MVQPHRAVVALGLCLALSASAWSQTSDTERLIAEERVRSSVEEAFELGVRPVDSGEERIENFMTAVSILVDAGPEAVPYLINEMRQALPQSFFLCAYALGLLGTPEAEAALRDTVQRADRAKGSFAVQRKAWAGHGLGLMGVVEALDLIQDGQHRVGVAAVYEDMTMTEFIGTLNAPASIPIHLDHIQRYRKDSLRDGDRAFDLRALRRIADISVVPRLLQVLRDDPLGAIRREAARSLQTMGTPEAVAGLIAALDDPDIRVRKSAALSLEIIDPEGSDEAIRAHLKKETDGYVRGPLYSVLAKSDDAVRLLGEYWGRPDDTDRTYLTRALGLTGSKEVLPLLRRSLSDPHPGVAAQAVVALDRLGTPEALHALIGAVSAPAWPTARAAAERLVERRETRGTTAIAERLIDVELDGVMTDPNRRIRVEVLGQALVRMGYTPRIEEIRQARERQTDATLVQMLDDLLEQLEVVKGNGGKREAWIETARSSDPALRRMAYEWLGREAGSQATAALVAHFGRVDPHEGREILRALAGNDSPEAVALIRRVLLEPEFDRWQRLPLREMAAWAARRIGGQAMFELLVQAADRRQGVDGAVMVYLGLLGGDKALPVLARNRLLPLRSLGWHLGEQLDTLDYMARRIRTGRPLDDLDQPPDALPF